MGFSASSAVPTSFGTRGDATTGDFFDAVLRDLLNPSLDVFCRDKCALLPVRGQVRLSRLETPSSEAFDGVLLKVARVAMEGRVRQETSDRNSSSLRFALVLLLFKLDDSLEDKSFGLIRLFLLRDGGHTSIFAVSDCNGLERTSHVKVFVNCLRSVYKRFSCDPRFAQYP